MFTFVSEMTRRHSLDGGVTQTGTLGVTQTDPYGVTHTVLAVVEGRIWWVWKRGRSGSGSADLVFIIQEALC
jgi:hypothetical protein